MADRQVLEAAQTTSAEFTVSGGAHQIVLTGHSGGTWNVEYQREVGGDWVDLDLDFTSNGVQRFSGVINGRYRIRGGSVGAEAWVIPESGASEAITPVLVKDGS